jgi:outer membrane protein assembly factor BamB
MKSRVFAVVMGVLSVWLFVSAGSGLAVADSLYVVDNGTDSVLKFDGLTGALIGTFGSADGGGRPYGLTCAPNGNLLVTREENDEVVEFDNATGALVRVFAGTGLNNPTGLALGPNGNLFVANRDGYDIVEFDGTTGAFVRTFASGLPGAPFSIAFGPNGNLFVALGFGGGQAVELDGSTGAVVRNFSTSGELRGLTFGPSGNLFVSSLNTNTVAEFDITTAALVRTLSGGLTHPHGLTFGPNGNLFVADFFTQRVSEFDGASGGVIGPFVSSGLANPIELMFGPSSGPCGPTKVRALVPLQNGTATFSSPVNFQHSPDQAIDGIFDDSTGSWAIARYDGFGGTNPETAVWETVTDLNADLLSFTMYFNHSNPGHLLGRFRLSVTTDDRSTFADGLDTGGAVNANWVVLENPIVHGPAGMTFTTLSDSSVLAGGTTVAQGIYTVTYEKPVSGITGVRLEALEDPSLPGGNGPGLFERNGNFLLNEITLKAEIAMTIPVTIDIKPGSFPNSINPRNNGVIPVAILTTATFDAATVDPATVRFGAKGTEASPQHYALADMNGDGKADLVLQFPTQNTGIACATTSATLSGKTVIGLPITGTDTVKTAGCK